MNNKYYRYFHDQTQSALTDYLVRTEVALKELIKTFDPNGRVEIIPTMDLGMPNNLIRLCGGFATGMAILWRCNRPIAFVDATINSCISSYFELDVSDEFIEEIPYEETQNYVKKVFRSYHMYQKNNHHLLHRIR